MEQLIITLQDMWINYVTNHNIVLKHSFYFVHAGGEMNLTDYAEDCWSN